jgi:DNA-binding SARP family transcriptional activator
MSKLAINYLGDFQVLRDGREVKLPPSRKTRALLAYLSLNQRRFRRDFLCELLWEIPDDPRGSLRWSLSKLRRLIDDEDRQRIIADRTHVEIDTSDTDIDAVRLCSLAGDGLADASTESLEDAADSYRGNFLEGLDLPNFHDFHAWCVAERAQVARAQVALLKELVSRLNAEPERALVYARALVAVSPYDEELRAGLIRLLVALGRTDEAEQHYQLGRRMLKEIGAVPGGLMEAARRPPQTERRPGSVVVEPQLRLLDTGIGLSSGLVGREAEAGELARLLHEVREHRQARFAFVRGEPGIGKTRLIEAVTALASGAGETILSASAYESESIRPFALWMDALHRYDVAAAAEIFGDREAGNRDRLFDRLSAFIAAKSEKKPLVLVFDDLHWCDDSSAAAIHYVARMNQDRPILGILASRDSEFRDNMPAQQAVAGLRRDQILTEIDLGPLSEGDLASLISERAPDVHADELSRQCGGNPLLAIELARAEQEGDSSKSVAELVRERMARFSIDGAEVLQWAAVLDPHINIDSIAELADIDVVQVGEILEAAERQGMFTATGSGLVFSHNLLARAVYSTLSPLRRQVMHRRVADRLEHSAALDLGRAADLAHHAAQSGDDGLAARAMVSAGRLCLRFYANDEAMTLVRRGMQLVGNLPEPERVCVTIDLNDIKLAAGPLDDWEASAREYAMLAEQALDHGELGHARLGYHMSASLRWEHGQWAHAREESLQSERAVRSGREEDHIVGMAHTAKCLAMIERDLPKADAMLMEAQSLSSRKGFSHFAIPAGLGMLRFHENKMDEAVELFKESRTLCKSAGARIDEFQANEYLVMIEFQRGNYEKAKSYCEALEAIGDKLRGGSEGPFARALSALCDYALSDSSKRLETALDELRVVDAKHRLAYTLSRAAQLDCERGRLEDAARRATEALKYATLLHRATEMALARAILACTSQANGDAEAVAEHEAAIAELEKAGVAVWASNMFRQEAARKGAAQL